MRSNNSLYSLFLNNILKIVFTVLLCASFSLVKTAAENLDDEGVQKIRMQWFYNQRSFPINTIPQGSYSLAMNQITALVKSSGYYSGSNNWVLIGPLPAHLGPAVSGRVAAVKYHPGDTTGNTIFIGGAEGGVWKTTDGGTTWIAKTDFLSSLSSGALEIGQNSSGEFTNIYYGTGESHAGFNFCYFGDGFFKSTDNGESWNKINDPNLPGVPTYFSRIVVRPGHPNELLAACGTNHANISYQSGLYRSTDYGETWLPRLVPNPSSEGRVVNDIVFSPDGNRAYMIGPDESSEQIYEKGVHYRISTDGGATFGKARDDIIIPRGRSHITISQSDPNIIYILTGVVNACLPGSCTQYEYHTGLYKSTDAGLSFSLYYEIMGLSCSCMGGDAYQSYYDMFVYCTPANPNTVYIGLINLWVSFDGGLNFSIITPPHSDMQNFDINRYNSNDVVLATDGGMYRSTDGGIGRGWLNLNENLTLTQFYRFSSGTFNPEIVVAGAQDNGIQSKYIGNMSFRDVLGGGDGTAIYASKTEPNIMFGGMGNYVGGGPPPILRTTNGGNEFIGVFYPDNGIWDSQNDWIPALTSVIDPLTSLETFFTSRRVTTITQPKISVYRTLDYGDTWEEVGNGIPVGDSPQNLASAPSNHNVLYLSTGSYAWPNASQRMYRSPDGGVSWLEVIDGSGNKIPKRYITHIEVDPADENTVFVSLSGFNSGTPGSPGHVFRSQDGGSTWQNLSSNLPDIPVNDLIIIRPGEKYLIAATDVGVLINSNGGNDWIELGPGMPHSAVTDIEYNPFSGKVRAGTFGRGIFELKLITSSYNINYPIVLNSDQSGLNIEQDLVIQTGGKLMIPKSCTIKMAPGKKIIVEKGGQISVTAPYVVFTSETGTWGGIEIKEYGFGSIKNCTFNNTETPITVSGELKTERPVEISNCTFNKGSVIASGRKFISVNGCTFNEGSPITGTAISLVYCNDIKITNNNINSPAVTGITVSNSSAEITGNTINYTGKVTPPAGISFDNCNAGTVNNNTVNNFQQSINYFNSLLGDIAIKSEGNEKLTTELNIIEKNILSLAGNDKKQNTTSTGLNPSSYPDGARMIISKLFGDFKVEEENTLPTEFSLSQNFPNPFNPVTTIKFNIPAGSEGNKAVLEVFDITGRVVKTIFSSHVQPGTHQAEFNGSNLSSGIYFYRLLVSGINGDVKFNDSKKMILVK